MTLPLFLRRWRWKIVVNLLRFGIYSQDREIKFITKLRKIILRLGLAI